jgi:hypothetical protein
MLNADQMKVILIDYLLNKSTPDLLVSEFSYLQGYRKADLAIFESNKTTAFEIKSPRDKLDRLPAQMADYTSVFTYCYLVTTFDHLRKAKSYISPKIGILIIDENQVIVQREPKENKKLSKHSLSQSIPYEEFSVDMSFRHRVKSKNTITNRIKVIDLQNKFYKSMYNKYNRKYKSFILDRGSKTSLTDLYYLQSS